MVKNMNLSSGIIDNLLNEFSIHEIESAVIQLFLDDNNVSFSKNLLIKEFMENNKNIDDIKVVIKNYCSNFDLKAVERIFELLIPKEDRETNGAFYTPNIIIKYIVDNCITGDETVCDPSCGSGGFLLEATKRIQHLTNKSVIQILENNIFGCDILDYAVKRTKILLTLYALYNSEDTNQIEFNIINENSLLCDWNSIFPNILGQKGIFATKKDLIKGFDVIIGNPPYLRIQDLDLETKHNLIKKWSNINKGNFNIYFTFFYLGYQLLKPKGKLGYITPNNFFTSLSGRKLREWMVNKLEIIMDFKHLKIFQDVSTYTCIVILSKIEKSYFKYKPIEKSIDLNLNNENLSIIYVKDLNNKKWRLLESQDQENIKKIENCGEKLGDLTNIKAGIATLKDKLYFIEGDFEDGEFYYKMFNNISYPIEKEITRSIIKISTVKNENDIKNNTLRIIFPYYSHPKVQIIPEEILIKKYPKCYEYLYAIKNELSKRDKGKKKYESWYAYGRKQGVDTYGLKLLTPTFSKKPRFLLDSDEFSLFCNGYAIFEKNGVDLRIIQKILNSIVMDYYINKTSVNIEGGFPCFQKNFIELFSIPNLDDNDRNFLLKEKSNEKIDEFLIKLYDLDIKPLINFQRR